MFFLHTTDIFYQVFLWSLGFIVFLQHIPSICGLFLAFMARKSLLYLEGNVYGKHKNSKHT